MTITRLIAKRLCTADEYELGNESFSPAVRALDNKALKDRIRRTRTLRDKQRTLAEKQAREISGKAKPTRSKRATNNDNTRLKQQFFTETLARFEKRLAACEKKQAGQDKNAAKKSAGKSSVASPPLKKGVIRATKELPKQTAKRTAKATNLRNTNQPATRDFQVPKVNPNLPAMSGAASAANRRFQGKHDSK